MNPIELEVDIWFDLICPWCLIGKRNFERARESLAERAPRLGLRTRWHGMQLLPALPPGGVPFAEFYARRLGGEQAVRTRQAQVQEAAAAAGLQLEFARIRTMPNTFEAHRVLEWTLETAGEAAHERMLERLFGAYFQRGEDIGAHGTLIALATECELDGEALAGALADTAATPRAARSTPNGVPYYVFGGRLALSGAQPPALLLAAMLEAAHAPHVAAVETR